MRERDVKLTPSQLVLQIYGEFFNLPNFCKTFLTFFSSYEELVGKGRIRTSEDSEEPVTFTDVTPVDRFGTFPYFKERFLIVCLTNIR